MALSKTIKILVEPQVIRLLVENIVQVYKVCSSLCTPNNGKMNLQMNYENSNEVGIQKSYCGFKCFCCLTTEYGELVVTVSTDSRPEGFSKAMLNIVNHRAQCWGAWRLGYDEGTCNIK